MKYSLGLDIGSESVGWAVVELDEEGNPKKLINMGVRTFDAVVGEQQKAETPAKTRRDARSVRRRLRNKKKRKKRFIEAAIKYGLLNDKLEAAEILQSNSHYSPWKLRVEGLDRPLSPEEWFRVLYHILNHRGFKSEKAAEEEDSKADEVKKMKASAQSLSNAWKSKGYRTVAEFLEKDEEWKREKGERRRNKEGDYSFTVLRDDLIYEARLLFELQRKLGSSYASKEFEDEYLSILDEKPKIQEGEDLKKLVGPCTFEIDEKRAPKGTLTGQLFVALQTLNNNPIVNYETGEEIRMNRDLLQKIIEKAFKKGSMKAADILKIFGVEDGSLGKFDKNEKVVNLEYYHQVKRKLSKEFPEDWKKVERNEDLFNALAEVLTYYKTVDNKLSKLLELGFSEGAAKKLLGLSFKGHLSLSLKAMKKINQYLWEGKVYYDAITLAGYSNSSNNKKSSDGQASKIPPFDSDEMPYDLRQKFMGITNPNVVRALTQARKVINAIIREYGGPPDRFVIELAREFALSRKEKKKIQKEQHARKEERLRAIDQIKEILGDQANINEKMITKKILYDQQERKSAYSLKEIDLYTMLTDDSYTEIDHIIPRSLSFDNSMSNKVLVLADDNRNKGDQLAATFIKKAFGEDGFNKFQNEFIEAILKRKMSEQSHRKREIYRKIKLLLKEEFTEEEKIKVQRRMLHATQHAARFLKEVLERLFPKSDVIPVTGKLVSELRSLTGLASLKRRGESDRHHAVDAALCAISDRKIVKRMADYLKKKERYYRYHKSKAIDFETGELIDYEKIFEPYPGFRAEVEKKFDEILVSRMPRRKAKGAGHEETILSLKHVIRSGVDIPPKGRISLRSDGPRPTKRVRLVDLTERQIEEILKEPSPILVDEKSNWTLYSLIRKRLREVENQVEDKKKWAEIAFGGEAGKIYMPTKTGEKGPEVRKIKIFTNSLSGIRVRGGMAENKTIVRLDFYRKLIKKGKYRYYVVPVYASDIALGIIPNKAAVIMKPESEWTKIDDTFEFLFHLFPGDYLRIQKNQDEEPEIYVFRYFDRSTCRILVDYPDRSNRKKPGDLIGISLSNCFKIEKLHVDILGRAYVVKKEKKIYS